MLALLVVAGSAAGGYALLKVFEPRGNAGSNPASDGLIAFDAARHGQWDIFVVNPDGTGLTNITEDNRDQRQPSWSPDGTRLMFLEQRGSGMSIIVRDMRSGQSTSLAWMTGGLSDTGPTWSPDGRYVAYAREALFIVPMDGTMPARQVANGYWAVSEGSWSPDGEHLTFAGVETRGDWSPSVYTVEIDGDTVTKLTPESEYAYDPRWSPTGEWIAFLYDVNRHSGVDLIRPDGTDRHKIGGREVGGPLDWSPDGTRLAAGYWRDYEDTGLAIAGIDGSLEIFRQLEFEHLSTVAWSPNGDKLIIQAGRFCDGGLYVIGEEGTRLAKVSPRQGWFAIPDWGMWAGLPPLPGPTATSGPTPAPAPTSSSSPQPAPIDRYC
jgi:TolB protein